MTFIKSTAAVSQLQLLPTSTPTTTAAAPLPVPPVPVNQIVLSRTITAAQTDFLFSANQGTRPMLCTITNEFASTAVLTISAQTGETVTHPTQGTALTCTLQPGETITFENKSATSWSYI